VLTYPDAVRIAGTVSQSWVDRALAIVTAVGAAIGTGVVPVTDSRPHPLDVVGYLLVVGAALGLLARRRWPAATAAGTVAAFVLYYASGYPGEIFAVVPAVIALYTAVSLGRRWPGVAGMIALCLGKLAGGWLVTGDPLHSVPVVAVTSGWFIAILVWAEVTRHRRAYLHEVEQRALDAERIREETAARRADEERLRIAQELHDTLTHAISVVNVQSGVALHLLHRKPHLVEPALLAIREASREAMRELRATLGVLRSAGEDVPPSLARLPLLTARFEQSGLCVRLRVDGERRPTPPDVEHAAYRIIQEALTNSARHAGPAAVRAAITYHPTHLDVRVEDDGPAVTAPIVEGHGLRGMRERATALGGTVSAGPGDDVGFRIHVTLPLPPQPAGSAGPGVPGPPARPAPARTEHAA
jgi:signal transduction histidine kinase